MCRPIKDCRCNNIMKHNIIPNNECFSFQKGRTNTWKWGEDKGKTLQNARFQVRFPMSKGHRSSGREWHMWRKAGITSKQHWGLFKSFTSKGLYSTNFKVFSMSTFGNKIGHQIFKMGKNKVVVFSSSSYNLMVRKTHWSH